MFRSLHPSGSVLKYLLVLSLLLMAAGCAQNIQYRPKYDTCTYSKPGDCATNALQTHALNQNDEYTLGFVEFDDQGQLRDRNQMQSVLDTYYKLTSGNDVLLIVFVHGWHHSAEPGDENIQRFRELLVRLSRAEHTNARQHALRARKVLGVYLGWRGDSISIPYLNGITFWDRKNTAHTVGLQGVTEVLLKLEEIVNVKGAMELAGKKPVNSRLVVIGHSFGGAVVYTSLQQVLADRFIGSRVGKAYVGDAGGYGDLVVLVNPAFEATRFATLFDISQEGCRRYAHTQLPKLVILTSKKDYATKYVFPFGRFFSTMFESDTVLHRHECTSHGEKELLVDEGEASRNTVGHFAPYITHDLVPAKTKQLRGAAFTFQKLKNTWSNQIPGGTLHFEDTDLVHLDKTTPLNPYLNISVDGRLIPNHNDIWGDAVVSFIRDLIVVSTLPAGQVKK